VLLHAFVQRSWQLIPWLLAVHRKRLSLKVHQDDLLWKTMKELAPEEAAWPGV
jgi:hypothetical protein